MRIRGDFCELLSHQVQNRECAASSRPRYFARQEFFSSESDDDMLASGVIADVIGIQIERHGLQKLKCGAVKNLHGAVAPAGHEQTIGFRVVERTLRLIQIRNRVDLAACL